MAENWRIAVGALLDKKVRNLKVIDISKLTTIASVFVICSGSSSTHIRAMADYVEEKMDEHFVRRNGRTGYDTARWILLDYSDVVIHIFHEEDRDFYDLERLWRDGELLLVNDVN